MAVQGPFDSYDATAVMEEAVRSYWGSQIERGVETIPFDDLDPVRQHEVRSYFFAVAPHVIRSLKDSIFKRAPIEVPDVIPDYFFGENS